MHIFAHGANVMKGSNSQLTSVKRLLKEAYELVGDARTIFGSYGEEKAAERLKKIGEAVTDEIEYVDRLLSAQS
jgi:hypothetical protein